MFFLKYKKRGFPNTSDLMLYLLNDFREYKQEIRRQMENRSEIRSNNDYLSRHYNKVSVYTFKQYLGQYWGRGRILQLFPDQDPKPLLIKDFLTFAAPLGINMDAQD